MDLFSHLWRVAGLGRIVVVLEFHPPVTLGEFASRKGLSEHCQRIVAEGVAAAIVGRREETQKTVADPAGSAPPGAKGYT
jgi:1-acyl-sn-glycerol-3-phosphate acyltransferase